VLSVLEELRHEGDYLYVDRLVDLLRPQTGQTSIADMLAPAVAQGQIAIIAECTEAEYERCLRMAPSFVAQFQIHRVHPTTPSQVPALMEEWLERRRVGLDVSPASWRRLVSHLSLFSPAGSFPGKAFAFV